MLINKELDNEMTAPDTRVNITRVMQANGITWAVAYVGYPRNHDHGWFGYPEENYSLAYGLAAICADTEEEVIDEIRRWK